MAQIQIVITRPGQTVPAHISNVPDADLDAIVATYQNEANAAIFGVATYAQVLQFVVSQWFGATKRRVQQANTVPASVPAPINLN